LISLHNFKKQALRIFGHEDFIGKWVQSLNYAAKNKVRIIRGKFQHQL